MGDMHTGSWKMRSANCYLHVSNGRIFAMRFPRIIVELSIDGKTIEGHPHRYRTTPQLIEIHTTISTSSGFFCSIYHQTPPFGSLVVRRRGLMGHDYRTSPSNVCVIDDTAHRQNHIKRRMHRSDAPPRERREAFKVGQRQSTVDAARFGLTGSLKQSWLNVTKNVTFRSSDQLLEST